VGGGGGVGGGAGDGGIYLTLGTTDRAGRKILN